MSLDKSIVTFSFDDARYDSYNAIKMAVENGVACTLNVTTGYVDGSLPISEWPTILNPMSKEQILELYNMGVEIAGHGDKHNNEHDCLIHGCEKLRDWLQIKDITQLGIASPHSRFHVDKENVQFVKDNFLYCRVGGYLNGLSKTKRYIQKLARITGSRWLFKIAYNDTVKNAYAYYPLIRSVPVLHDNTVEQMKSIIELSIRKRYMCVLCFHSILSPGEQEYNSNFSWDINKYSSLVRWISTNNNIEKITTKNAFQIVKDIKEQVGG